MKPDNLTQERPHRHLIRRIEDCRHGSARLDRLIREEAGEPPGIRFLKGEPREPLPEVGFPLIFGGLFGGIPTLMSLVPFFNAPFWILGPLGLVLFLVGLRAGRRMPPWLRELRGESVAATGKRSKGSTTSSRTSSSSSSGWVMGGSSSGSNGSSSWGSGSSSSGSSFGGGSSGGGGAPGRW